MNLLRRLMVRAVQRTCGWRGHDWKKVRDKWDPPFLHPFAVCKRCGKTGTLLRDGTVLVLGEIKEG